MPLTLAKPGQEVHVERVMGNDKTRQFLANLGFITGTPISVVSKIDGSLIVHVKDARVAISKEMAKKIIIY